MSKNFAGEKNRHLTYGTFNPEVHVTAGGAVSMGAFVGSTWAVGVFVCWAVATAIASGGLDQTTGIVLSVAVAMLAGGILQQLWFNFAPAFRLSYPRRIAGFGVTYYVVLLACAAMGAWLPFGNPYAVAGFTITYLAILAILTVAFTVALRHRVAEYQRVLDRFHQGRTRR
ncbi:hypothetical protein [Parafannyhessea umbonata]|uniref:hypothetical protein n=1 Tax=Parafannyhessea umbonata TaxID=604330 RepID=UPI00359C8F0D